MSIHNQPPSPRAPSQSLLWTALLLGLSFALPVGAQEPPEPSQAVEQSEVDQAQKIIVNGKELTDSEVQQLVNLYGRVYIGRYWYDPISGLYGQEGGPPMGQLHPRLNVRGELAADASGGGDGRLTGTFINGREIHPVEYAFYTRVLGQVWPGRFWMNARGQGGYEYGPMLFDIPAALARSAGGGGSDSHYLSGIGGKPGTHVGRASDGCVYVSQGGYSAESC